MTVTQRRLPLNPCDYFIYGGHQALARRRGGANIAFTFFDAAGLADPGIVRRALTDVMVAHPVLMARLRFSLLSGRPYWQTPPTPSAAAGPAADAAYTHTNLRGHEDWQQRLDALCQARLCPDWDLRAGPQIRLEHYSLPGDGSRFCLRWAHHFTDAEGAHHLVAELCEQSRRYSGAPPRDEPVSHACESPYAEHADKDRSPDILAGVPFRSRLRLIARGLARRAAPAELKINPAVPSAGQTPVEHRFLIRAFSPEHTRIMQVNARHSTPPGPGLYARYLAACVFRALHRIHAELDVQTDAYVLTFPQPIGLPDERAGSTASRPLHGNYVVAPTIYAHRDRVDDLRALGEDILRQLEDLRRGQANLAQWSMLWAASFLRPSLQRLLYKLPLGYEQLCSGFAYYRSPIGPPLSLAGAPIVNLCGGAPVATPPGWNPVFGTFGDRLTLVLIWNRPAISDELAGRYADRIEEQIFEHST